VDLARVCEVGTEGVDKGFGGDLRGEGGEVDVEYLVAAGEEVGYDVLAGFARAACDNDSFAHCVFWQDWNELKGMEVFWGEGVYK